MKELIIVNMPIAKGVAKRYAYKYKRHEDECIAEAYFQLTLLFTEKLELYLKAETPHIFLKVFITRGMTNYFKKRTPSNNLNMAWFALGRSEQDMFDYLEQFFPDCRDILKLMMDGFSADDIMFLKNQYRKKIKPIEKKRRDRIKNIIKLAEASNKPVGAEVYEHMNMQSPEVAI